MALSKRSRRALDLQRGFSRVFLVLQGLWVSCLFHFFYRYRIVNMAQIRREYQEIMKGKQKPLLICSNHLSLIDSILHVIALNSVLGHLWNFSGFPWNVPEKGNFYHNWYWRAFCYLGKCIPVERQGSTEVAKLNREKMLYVIHKGDVLSIFPEGTRSRNGLVENKNFSYGTGKVLQHLPEAKVLCIYMRGKKWGGFSSFPPKGEDFYFSMQVLKPRSELVGLRKVRDLSTQIIHKLKEMEEECLGSANLGWK